MVLFHDFVYASTEGIFLILLFLACAISLFFGIITSKEFEYHDFLVKLYEKIFKK